MIGSPLVMLVLVYFVGMLFALAFALLDLDERVGEYPHQTMSDVAIMCLGYMVTRMALWPYYAAVFVCSSLKARG
jgi:hypothetical protein